MAFIVFKVQLIKTKTERIEALETTQSAYISIFKSNQFTKKKSFENLQIKEEKKLCLRSSGANFRTKDWPHDPHTFDVQWSRQNHNLEHKCQKEIGDFALPS